MNSAKESLAQAIARNSAAVLSLPSAGMLRHYKTRFLADGEGGFWIESVTNEAALIDELIVKQSPVGIAYKSGETKVIFASPIWRRQPDFSLNNDSKIEALLLAMPQDLKAVQRRAAYRVLIPSACPLGVRVWRIPEHAVLRDRPSATLEMAVRPRDISIGGVCLLAPAKDGEAQKIITDQRLRLQLSYEGIDALVEGRAKHVSANPDKSLRIGVQFKKLENDLEGRQNLSKLTTIVGQLHREEVRRIRLGLTG